MVITASPVVTWVICGNKADTGVVTRMLRWMERPSYSRL